MKITRTQNFLAAALVVALALAATGTQAQDIRPVEARVIAREAYIYGYPMAHSYRILNSYFVDRENPEYKGVEQNPQHPLRPMNCTCTTG